MDLSTALRPFRNLSGGTPVSLKPSATTYGYSQPKDAESYQKKILFGNADNTRIIKQFILDKLEKKEDAPPYILLVGDVGVGKSELLRTCFDECNCNLVEYDEELRANTYEILRDSLISSNVECLFSELKKRIGVVIDNYQTTILASHRKEFLEFLRNNRTSPVIFTCDTISNTTDLQRGKGIVLRFEPPTKEDLFGLAKKLSTLADDQIRTLVEECHPDIRALKNALEFSKTPVHFQDPNMDIYDNIVYFFGDTSFKDKLRQSSFFTSHIVQENYLSCMPKDAKLENMWEMAEYCSLGDIVKESAFQNQAWDYMNDISNSLGTLGPTYVLRDLGVTKPIVKVPNRKVVNVPLYYSTVRMDLIDIYFVLTKIVGDPTRIEANMADFFEFANRLGFEMALRLLNLGYSFIGTPYKDIKRINSKLKKYYDANFSEQ